MVQDLILILVPYSFPIILGRTLTQAAYYCFGISSHIITIQKFY